MKPALGKGLSALIPEKKKIDAKGIFELELDSIVPNEYQPRRIFNDKAINDLVASIKEKGVIQPVIVRKTAGSVYQLIAGERRWRSAKIAGLASCTEDVLQAAFQRFSCTTLRDRKHQFIEKR